MNQVIKVDDDGDECDWNLIAQKWLWMNAHASLMPPLQSINQT